MPGKPKTIYGYENGQVELVLMTCRYISTIWGDFMDEMVIVGGLVPSLIIDQTALPEGAEPHAGTMDLDIGLSIAVYDDQLYQTITKRLRGAGFSPDVNEKGNPTNQRWQIGGAADGEPPEAGGGAVQSAQLGAARGVCVSIMIIGHAF